MTRLARRTLLALGLLNALAACATDPEPDEEPAVTLPRTEQPPGRAERLVYGQDPSQWADLYRPAGESKGVVVVIHGGFWKAEYDAGLGVPLAEDLLGRGWTVANLEYRRVGNGGGFPATFDDVAAGIDRLADVEGLDLGTVVTLGHSAGGHLAAWAAARGRFPAWAPERVAVTAVVSQAGVLDLVTAAEQFLGTGAVQALLGGPPGREVDPVQQLPLQVPVWCVHGRADDIVPLSQSRRYVRAAAAAAGAPAELVEVDGDHFVVIDTGSVAWARTIAILEGLR